MLTIPNKEAVMLAEPDYKSEYKRLFDENIHLKKEVAELHMTIIEMCKYIFTSRFKD